MRLYLTAYWRTLKDRRYWAALALVSVCAAAGSIVGMLSGYPTLGAAIGGGIGGLVAGPTLMRLMQPHLRDLPNSERKT
jgi:hypothetical protein